MQQVLQHLRQAGRIGDQFDRAGRQHHLHGLAALPDRGLDRVHRSAHPRAQVHRLGAQLDLAAGDAADFEQVVDQAGELIGLAHGHRQRGAVGAGQRLAARQQPVRVGQRRQRVAQLVGQHGKELVLAPVGLGQRRGGGMQLVEVAPGLVLALAHPQAGARQADQRRRVERALQQQHVAQQLGQVQRGPLPPGRAGPPGHDDDRQVRPRRLLRHPARQAGRTGRVQGLFGQAGRRRAAFELADQFVQVGAFMLRQAALAQDRAGHRRVAPAGGQHKHAVPRRSGWRVAHAGVSGAAGKAPSSASCSP